MVKRCEQEVQDDEDKDEMGPESDDEDVAMEEDEIHSLLVDAEDRGKAGKEVAVPKTKWQKKNKGWAYKCIPDTFQPSRKSRNAEIIRVQRV